LTSITERIRAQFDNLNIVYRVQFEAEFRAYQEIWLAAHNVFRENVILNSLQGVASRTKEQFDKFQVAQRTFSDTLVGCRPFIPEDVWRAFYDFEDVMIDDKMRQLTPIPNEELHPHREKTRLAFERCGEQVRKRLAGLLAV
jgi:hypothetical protein